MAGAALAAEITTVSVGRQEPEDVSLLGRRRQIELVSHFFCLSLRSVKRKLQAREVSVSRADMGLRQACSSAKKLLPQCSRSVVVFVSTSLLQFWDKVRHNIAERLVGHRIGKIEAVNVGVLDPFLEQIRGGLRTAHKQRPETSDADPFGELAHSPDFAGIGAGTRFDR